ncbi:lipocalin family protein [Zobellia alginiliquefaciens]|uniref:lipocalin family protein n=1 Tax=Zobellia alginiliquefaciens TaxID=3032586 RepID=UPI0023E38EFB|nr:lipocalin family protein [Zobellia alginiliquefaciens]
MRKQKLFLGLMLATTMFISCSSDDNDTEEEMETPDYAELILGEWNYVSQTLNGEDYPFEDECQKEFEYQIFTSDGIYNQTEFENISGDGCEQVESSTGVWSIEDSILNLMLDYEDSENYELTILELTEETLSYQIDIDIDGDEEIDDYIVTLSRRN